MAKFYSSAVPEYQADKEQFEFVQMKDDIADATFQDKPIGFFKDAMLRFCRSKVSIVAFVGIVIILFMAIFMPMMSHWHYNDQDLNRINLPPKMPVLENVGILDGTRWLTNRRGQPGRYNTLSGRQHSESHQLPEGPGRGYV